MTKASTAIQPAAKRAAVAMRQGWQCLCGYCGKAAEMATLGWKLRQCGRDSGDWVDDAEIGHSNWDSGGSGDYAAELEVGLEVTAMRW